MIHSSHELISKIRHRLRLDRMPSLVRKIVVSVVGTILFGAGLVMIITPGPAFIFIPLGLLLLATEFKWAERWADAVVRAIERVADKWRAYRRRRKAA